MRVIAPPKRAIEEAAAMSAWLNFVIGFVCVVGLAPREHTISVPAGNQLPHPGDFLNGFSPSTG